jgi:AraC-like DNA-binding protein
MKLKYKVMEGQLRTSFHARREFVPYFDNEWHFHEELELIYFHKGKGVRYIGNTMGNFQDGEIYLAGPNIPHLYKNEIEENGDDRQNSSVDQVIIHFRKDFLGKHFIGLPEVSMLNNLFAKSEKVLKFSKITSSLLHNYLIGITCKEGVSRITDLLRILDILSISKDYETIMQIGSVTTHSKSDKDRMSKIINFLNDNYAKKIELSEVAAIASMTPNSLCRFFKRNTNKPFSAYLNEIRIGNACKLLIEGELTVAEVSYATGFYSISNFNRTFREVMNLTPSEYKKKYNKQMEVAE